MEKIRIVMRAFDHRVLDSFMEKFLNILREAGAKIKGPVPLPRKITRFTVLRSPHVNKDSREQFEIREYKRLVDIVNPSKDIIDRLQKMNVPSGVEIELKAAKK